MKRLKRTDTSGFALAFLIPFVLVGAGSFVGIGEWLSILEWKLAVSIPVGVAAGVVGSALFRRYRQWKLFERVDDRSEGTKSILALTIKNKHGDLDYYKIATIVKIVLIGIPSAVLVFFAGAHAIESYREYLYNSSAEKQVVVRRGWGAVESEEVAPDKPSSSREESLSDLDREFELIEMKRLSDRELLQNAFSSLPPAIALFSIDNGIEMDVSTLSWQMSRVYTDRLRRLDLKYAENEREIARLTANAAADLADAGVMEHSLFILIRMDRLVDLPGRNVSYRIVLISYTHYRSLGVSDETITFMLEQELDQ